MPNQIPLTPTATVIMLPQDATDDGLFFGNMYPFLFLGCGKIYSLEQCVDFAILYAIGKINLQIDINH